MRVVRSYCIILRPTNASLALVYVRWDVKNNTWMLSEILRTLIVNIDYQVRQIYIVPFSFISKLQGNLPLYLFFSRLCFGYNKVFLDCRAKSLPFTSFVLKLVCTIKEGINSTL